jgi:hypothetical protein
MRFRLRLLVTATAAVGFVIGSAATALAGPPVPDASACGLDAKTPVVARFDSTPANGIWQRLPALGRSPELEEVSGTAHVLVLGDVTSPAMFGGQGQAGPTKLANAVCVVLPDGPVLYYNVSRQGFTAP